MKCPICKQHELVFQDARNGRQAAHCPKCNRGRALFTQDKSAPEPVPAAPKKEGKSE